MVDLRLLPIVIKWEDGSEETFDAVESLETDLEMFASESTPECEVRDRLGRRVRLTVDERLVLKEWSLLDAEPGPTAVR